MRLLQRAWSAAAAMGLLLSLSAQAGAQEKNVYFLSWGGTIQTMLEQEGWADEFESDTGYTVTLVPKATSSEIIATAIAQKDQPQVDVVMCDLVAFLQGVDQDVFADLDASEVPNLEKMYDFASVEGKGTYTYADVLALVYQTDVFERNGWERPTGWDDLFRPELQGSIIIPPVSNTYGLYALVQLARMNGGDERNIEPGFEALEELAPGVVDWTTTFAQIGTLFEGETAALAVFGNASGWEIKNRGVPVEVIIPDPSYISPTVAGIIENAPNPEGARVFLNWLISEKVLGYRAERFGQTPMNRDVTVTGDSAERVVTGEALERLVQLDYRHVLSERADWSQRFDREIAPIQ